MSVAILFVCAATAIYFYRSTVAQARLASVYANTATLRTELIVEHALTGRWPDLTREGTGLHESNTPIAHLSLNDGHFSLAVRVEGVDAGSPDGLSNVSFRRVVNPEFGTVMWLCGRAQPKPDWQVPIPDITDIPTGYLPPNCR